MQLKPTFSYSAKREYFFPVQGNLMVIKDTTINLQLNKSVATVEFIIQTDSVHIENAKVVLNKEIAWFNEEKKAKVYNNPINQLYTYSITSDNFPEYSDSLWVTKDTTVQVVLKYTSSQELNEALYFNVYPNPASNKVTIQNSTPDIDMIEIFDIKGTRVVIEEYDLPKQFVKIRLNLSPGVYLLKTTSGNLGKNSKLMIN